MIDEPSDAIASVTELVPDPPPDVIAECVVSGTRSYQFLELNNFPKYIIFIVPCDVS
jgi:hypothetical protein